MQAAIGSVQVGDVDSLLDALRVAGLSEGDLGNLQAAMIKDRNTTNRILGAALAAWLGKRLLRPPKGLTTIGTEVVSAAVLQGIRNFLGDTAQSSR